MGCDPNNNLGIILSFLSAVRFDFNILSSLSQSCHTFLTAATSSAFYLFIICQEYRDRVCSALAKYHGTPTGVNRRPRRKRSESTDTTRTSQKKEKSDVNSSFAGGSRIESQRLKLRKSKAPRFKDPLASSKLEMIKSIRAQRAIAETQKMEAIERARSVLSFFLFFSFLLAVS